MNEHFLKYFILLLKKRHRNDYITNLQKANIMNIDNEEFMTTNWKDLMVGAFVKVKNGEVFYNL